MAWHRAGIDVVGLGAGAAALVVSAAAVKVPIGLKQRAGRGGIETPSDIRPGNVAVPPNVAAGNPIGDTLIAKRVQKPVEYLGRVAISDGLKDTGFL
jgi:hypothetical protein